MITRVVAAFAAVLLLAATPPPAPSSVPGIPATGGLEQDAINAASNIVKSVFGWSDTESLGTVTYFRGYEMQVRMQLNRYREIHLHRGTVINPRGWSIAPGQTVDVRGRPNSDGSLTADTIVVQNPH